MTKVLITGTFDIIHPGHLDLIRQAKKFGDYLIVVIARDQNVLKIKGQKPLNKEEGRSKKLEALGLVDKVILGDPNDPYKIIKQEQPDIVALGYDQQAYVSGLEQLCLHSSFHTKIERLQPFKEDIAKGKSLRRALEAESAGFLLINKPEDFTPLENPLRERNSLTGLTSHDVVAKLRSLIGVKQIGHTGTLDPFATGLLICAVGEATKMVGLFDLLPKTYEAEIRLGIETDSYDRTGKVRSKKLEVRIDENQVREILKSFVGKQEQMPPMFSAKKVGGRKLYDLARKGMEVERKPSEIEIYDIQVLGTRDQELGIKVICSAGTYIRSLAHDLGQKLGIGACLWQLKRTAIGPFLVNQSLNLSEITRDNWQAQTIKPLRALEAINQTLITEWFK